MLETLYLEIIDSKFNRVDYKEAFPNSELEMSENTTISDEMTNYIDAMQNPFKIYLSYIPNN